MKLGAEAVFVGSGIFKSANPERRGKAIVTAVTQFADAKTLAKCSRGLGEAMKGQPAAELPEDKLLSVR